MTDNNKPIPTIGCCNSSCSNYPSADHYAQFNFPAPTYSSTTNISEEVLPNTFCLPDLSRPPPCLPPSYIPPSTIQSSISSTNFGGTHFTQPTADIFTYASYTSDHYVGNLSSAVNDYCENERTVASDENSWTSHPNSFPHINAHEENQSLRTPFSANYSLYSGRTELRKQSEVQEREEHSMHSGVRGSYVSIEKEFYSISTVERKNDECFLRLSDSGKRTLDYDGTDPRYVRPKRQKASINLEHNITHVRKSNSYSECNKEMARLRRSPNVREENVEENWRKVNVTSRECSGSVREFSRTCISRNSESIRMERYRSRSPRSCEVNRNYKAECVDYRYRQLECRNETKSNSFKDVGYRSRSQHDRARNKIVRTYHGHYRFRRSESCDQRDGNSLKDLNYRSKSPTAREVNIPADECDTSLSSYDYRKNKNLRLTDSDYPSKNTNISYRSGNKYDEKWSSKYGNALVKPRNPEFGENDENDAFDFEEDECLTASEASNSSGVEDSADVAAVRIRSSPADLFYRRDYNLGGALVATAKAKNLCLRFEEQILKRSIKAREHLIEQNQISAIETGHVSTEKCLTSISDSTAVKVKRHRCSPTSNRQYCSSDTANARLQTKNKIARRRSSSGSSSSCEEKKNVDIVTDSDEEACRQRKKRLAAKKKKHVNTDSHCHRAACKIACSDSSCTDDDNDCFDEVNHIERSKSVLQRKMRHPLRLHPELWHNDKGEMNDGPLCLCKKKARESGIRHGYFVGEQIVPLCDPWSNNATKLHHYKVTVSPSTNFLFKKPTTIRHDGHEFIFEGFSLFSHYPLEKSPTCRVVRFNIPYFVGFVEEPFVEGFCVKELQLFHEYLFTELLELVDLELRPFGDINSCQSFHLMPRFARQLADGMKELLSMCEVLRYLLSSSKPVVDPKNFSAIARMPMNDWLNSVDELKDMIVTFPGMKPSSVRVDQLDRDPLLASLARNDRITRPDGVFETGGNKSNEKVKDAHVGKFQEDEEGSRTDGKRVSCATELEATDGYPVIVHFGTRPTQLSYAGNQKYQKLWREFVKLRHLSANMEQTPATHKQRLQQCYEQLSAIRTSSLQKRDVTVGVSAKGFIRTGIMCDVSQHALLMPVLLVHLRFHASLRTLEENIQYSFKNRQLLQLALTHPSFRENFGTNPDHVRNSLTNCGVRQPEYGDRRALYMNTRKRGINTLMSIMARQALDQETDSQIMHNERLEFLGDAVVEFLTSIHLFHIFPDMEEGGLATFRAALVQNQHLAELADKLKLGNYLLFAHGSDLCHDFELRHAMANCFEALMAAIFLDSNIAKADEVLAHTLYGGLEKELQVWRDYPPHPLQLQEPFGDRHWIPQFKLLQDLVKFEESIGIKFKHIRLLARSFIDRSSGENNLTLGSNQRLEFLGDTVLQLLASEYLYKYFPDHHEGHLSLLRSSLVNNKTQAQVCNDLGLTQYASHTRTGTDYKMKHRADLLEAFLGALYVDRGLLVCRCFCDVLFFPRLHDFILNQDWNDPKSKLQQCCLTLRSMNGREPDIPEYKVLNSRGPTNTREYEVAVYFKQKRLATGRGQSIQAAEMNAAEEALEKYASKFPKLEQQRRAMRRALKHTAQELAVLDTSCYTILEGDKQLFAATRSQNTSDNAYAEHDFESDDAIIAPLSDSVKNEATQNSSKDGLDEKSSGKYPRWVVLSGAVDEMSGNRPLTLSDGKEDTVPVKKPKKDINEIKEKLAKLLASQAGKCTNSSSSLYVNKNNFLSETCETVCKNTEAEQSVVETDEILAITYLPESGHSDAAVNVRTHFGELKTSKSHIGDDGIHVAQAGDSKVVDETLDASANVNRIDSGDIKLDHIDINEIKSPENDETDVQAKVSTTNVLKTLATDVNCKPVDFHVSNYRHFDVSYTDAARIVGTDVEVDEYVTQGKDRITENTEIDFNDHSTVLPSDKADNALAGGELAPDLVMLSADEVLQTDSFHLNKCLSAEVNYSGPAEAFVEVVCDAKQNSEDDSFVRCKGAKMMDTANKSVVSRNVSSRSEVARNASDSSEAVFDVKDRSESVIEITDRFDGVRDVTDGTVVVMDVPDGTDGDKDVTDGFDVVRDVTAGFDVVRDATYGSDVVKVATYVSDISGNVIDRSDIVPNDAGRSIVIRDITGECESVGDVEKVPEHVKYIIKKSEINNDFSKYSDVAEDVTDGFEIVKDRSDSSEVVHDGTDSFEIRNVAVEPDIIKDIRGRSRVLKIVKNREYTNRFQVADFANRNSDVVDVTSRYEACKLTDKSEVQGNVELKTTNDKESAVRTEVTGEVLCVERNNGIKITNVDKIDPAVLPLPNIKEIENVARNAESSDFNDANMAVSNNQFDEVDGAIKCCPVDLAAIESNSPHDVSQISNVLHNDNSLMSEICRTVSKTKKKLGVSVLRCDENCSESARPCSDNINATRVSPADFSDGNDFKGDLPKYELSVNLPLLSMASFDQSKKVNLHGRNDQLLSGKDVSSQFFPIGSTMFSNQSVSERRVFQNIKKSPLGALGTRSPSRTIDTDLIPKIASIRSPSKMADRHSPLKMKDRRLPPRLMEKRSPPRRMDKPSPPRMLDGRSPPRVMDEYFPMKITDKRSPPRIKDRYPPPKIIDRHSPPRIMDRHSPPRIVDRHSPHRLMDRLSSHVLMDRHSSPRMMDRFAPPRMMNRRSPPRVMDRRSPPRVMDRHSPSRMLDRHSPPRMLDRHSPPRMLDRYSPPRMLDRFSPPRMLDTRSPPRMLDRRSPPRMLDSRSSPGMVDSRSSPRMVDRRSSPRMVDRRSPPRTLDRFSPPETYRESPSKVHRHSQKMVERRCPRMIERRSPRLMGRRSPRAMDRHSQRMPDRRSPRMLDRRSPRMMDRRSPHKIVDRHSPQRIMSGRSSPRMMDSQPPPIMIDSRSSPRMMDNRSPPRMMHRRSSVAMITRRMDMYSPPRRGDRRLPPIMMERHTPPRLMERRTPPRMMERRTPPRLIERRTPPRMMERRRSPRTMDRCSSPRVFDRRSPPRIIYRRTPPRMIDRRSPRHMIDRHSPHE